MLKHFLKRFWKLLIAIGVVGTALQVGLNIFPKLYYFSLSCIYKISLFLKISLDLTLTLFVLFVLCLLTLTLSLLCIFKKSIKTEHEVIVEEETLPKQMTDILKLLKNKNFMHSFEIKEKLNFTVDELSHYTKVLWLEEGYIEKEKLLQNEILPHHRNTDHSFKWKLTDDGIAYLIENQL